jgi:signal transduction histidine kinase/ligand-binding sensor domain-containing protein/DNA-binding response OmpR family regulator
MNRSCFSQNATERTHSHECSKLTLHEQNKQASCIRPLKNNFVQMKPLFILSLLVSLWLPVMPQNYTQFTHYSADEGLSENNVLCILQDRKGMMWFGTYDGLNKFDGYTFKTYKGNPGNQAALLNYRIDRIREDHDGYLWVQTYDGRIYRFDPGTENFLPVPQCLEEYKNYKMSLTGLTILGDGSVWITGGDHGDDDCFRILNTKNARQVHIEHFNTDNGQLTSSKVKRVYLDKAQNTWLLTGKGINLLKKNADRTIKYFAEKEDRDAGFSAICETSPFIYLGGGQGRFMMYDTRKGTFGNIKTPFLTTIIDILHIEPDRLFILTDKNGFYLFDLKTRKFEAFNTSSQCGLKSDNFYASYMDKHHNIWLNSNNSGVVLFDIEKKRVTNFNILSEKTSGLNFFVFEDMYENVWIHPQCGGFSRYSYSSNKLEPFFNDPGTADRKFSNTVRTAISDRQGNLWICPYTYGIEKVVFKKSPFTFYKPVPGHSYFDQNQVRAIFQDKDNWLWVGSKNGNLYLFDENCNLIGRLGADGRMNSSSPFNAPVYHMISDHTGAIWLATKGKGLFKVLKNGRGKYASFSLTNFQNNPKDIYSLSSNAVYSIFEDHQQRLWVATYGGGINRMEIQDGEVRFINCQNELKNYPRQCSRARFITEDRKGQMYVGTTEGLLACQCDNSPPEKIRFYHYSHIPEDPQTISGNDVHYILPSGNGNLYLGIYGGGLDVLANGLDFNQKPVFHTFKRNCGISSDVVFTLQEDVKGNIWLSTQTKLLRFDPQTCKFDTYSPITTNSYSFIEAAVCNTHQGDLVYGTTEGFVRFNPMKATKSKFIPRMVFTQLQLLNKPVEIDAAGSPLSRIMDDMQELRLTHKQNIISIGYAALDYTDPQNVRYAYKLDDIDADWNYVDNQRVATYANLPKGSYTFRVKSTNADGEWVNNERTIRIMKLPSFWESAWGYAFYLVIFLSVTILATYILFTFYRLKNDVLLEHRVTEMKLRFFADISHELRTPLTLIVSPIENILRREALPDIVKNQLVIVRRNTDRMLRLINQILDFHKIQSKKIKLEIEDIHVGQVTQEICSSFQKLAEDRDIRFRIEDKSNNAHLWVDKDKFEKILFNLLSNAFKFTPMGKSIEVVIAESFDYVSISFNDKGIGIGTEKLEHLFTRFGSFTSTDNPVQPGTGIGLSFTRELVELHKAMIDVESEKGKGSSFKVTFQKGHEHFRDDDNYILQDLNTKEPVKTPGKCIEKENEDTDNPVSVHAIEVPTILIVEDNTELRDFLSSVLSSQYNILEAENGKVAFSLLADSAPDMIISDIMMPEMTGLELAKAVKGDMNTSHIPMVLLTARNDIDSKLVAMEYGVDDYITKPFSSAYLEARIGNLLKLRTQLQDYYRSSLTSGVISISKPNVTSQDDIFIDRVMKYIEENIENSELSIDGIALFIGLSRSSMFKKIKSLTGLAPVDFIKEIRIQRAAQLIETGEFNISQVTYMVGMTDPRYFSKCFKQKYGVTPREYKDRCSSERSDR